MVTTQNHCNISTAADLSSFCKQVRLAGIAFGASKSCVYRLVFQDLGTGYDDALGHATKALLNVRSIKLPRVVSYPIMLLTFRSIPRLLVQAAKI